MSSSKKESEKLRAVIVDCLEKGDDYRKEFGRDRLATIDKYSSALGFSSNDLSQAQKDFLKSLTEDDVESFKRLYDKAQQHGLGEPLKAL
jgi:hypothetical protein